MFSHTLWKEFMAFNKSVNSYWCIKKQGLKLLNLNSSNDIVFGVGQPALAHCLHLSCTVYRGTTSEREMFCIIIVIIMITCLKLKCGEIVIRHTIQNKSICLKKRWILSSLCHFLQAIKHLFEVFGHQAHSVFDFGKKKKSGILVSSPTALWSMWFLAFCEVWKTAD